jgi:hypothetical protein
MDLDGDYVIKFTAIDPSSGSLVAGVNVSEASLFVSQLTPGTADDLAFGPFKPVFIPLPLGDLNSG